MVAILLVNVNGFCQLPILSAAMFFAVALAWRLAMSAVDEVRCASRRYSKLSIALFSLACVITVRVCATKPQTNDTDGVDVPTYGMMSAHIPPEIGGLTDEWDVFAVTNVHFSSFSKSGDVARAEISIGEGGVAYGDPIRIYATDNLEHPVWTNVYERYYEAESSLTVQFDMMSFPTSFLQRALFGLDYPQDSDGDGINDGDERYRYHSNPRKYDTDGDGLGDGDELRIGSSLISADTDGDGLSDSEEIGGALVATGPSMLWLDTSLCTECPLSYIDRSVDVYGGVTLAGTAYQDCSVNASGRVSFGGGAVTVDACGRSMYFDSSWGSGIRCGTVIEGGVEYFVVECRNISTDATGAAKMSCQIAIPKTERNVVYVSYQRVDDGIRRPLYEFGVICSNLASPFDCQSEYAILPPVGYRKPVANTTIKYVIGLGSDPTVYNHYEEPVLPPTSKSNAYYTVDIVADDHAHIVFSGDGPSDLPDPDFWTLPGDTNRVKLLIGKRYEIQGSSTFTVTASSDPDAVVSNISVLRKMVVSPVQIECVPPARGRLMATVGGGFTMNVYPSYLCGLFYWTNSCCQISGNGNVFNWWCSGCCCKGCTAKGYYRYEGYDIECMGIPCGCTPDDDDDDEGVSFELNMPNAMFVNNDDDDNDGVIDYGHNFDDGNEDDVVPVEMKLRNPRDESGTVTITMSGNFHGTIAEDDVSHTSIGQSKTWNIAAGESFERAILLDPSECSSSYNDCQLTVSWSLSGGAQGTETRNFTVVEPVAEPICNETKSVMIDGAVHHLTYNPCGVAVGKDAYFKVDVEPKSYPDSLIKWSVDATSVGDVSFPRGNTGREVKVRGVSEGSVLLNVQVGDCRSAAPKFSMKVVTNIVVDVCLTVLAKDDEPVKATDEINTLLKQVNDVYAQIGYSFNLKSSVITNIPQAYRVNYRGNEFDRWSISNLTEAIYIENGIKCIIVKEIVDVGGNQKINGVNWYNGLVLSAHSDGCVLAHELGHMFGLVDIYAECDGFDLGEKPFVGWCSPMDWNGGSSGPNNCSSRYYRSRTTCKDVITRLLMHGHTTDIVNNDMTIGNVAGLIIDESNEGHFLVDFADIGFFNDGEVLQIIPHE